MKDNDARGIVLSRLYELRHIRSQANAGDFSDLSVPSNVVPNILSQLAEKGLINWKPLRNSMYTYVAFTAHISAYGVDVIEGTQAAPIAINIDSSINVHGSQNVQVGQGNVQTVNMDVGKIINSIDGCGRIYGR